MRNPFVALDSFVIERVFEPIAWRIEYYTGKNNFWLARALWGVYVTAYIVGLDEVVVRIILFVAGVAGYFHFLDLERKLKPGFMSPERPKWVLRIILLFLLVAAAISRISAWLWLPHVQPLDPTIQTTYGPLITIGFVALMLVHYLLACSAMPPKWQQARQEKAQARKLAAQGI
jgi:hypothetical protein